MPVQELDTVLVIRENFIRPKPRKLAAIDTALPARSVYVDSSVSVLSGDVDLSALLKQPLKEEKLRYMANAPVFYIHDLKITDYRNLYFKRNHFVPVPGTVASSAAKEGVTPTSALKQNADYFLHEELADAMLQFKKGRYDRCIQTLNVVATYNKEDVNCDFYLGLCYYYKHNYAMAISLLDKCTVSLNNTFLQEAMYYKALCLMESGNADEAQKLFQQITEEGEFYSEKAKGYLKSAE
jgi:tetratricopeptide (TPR) repeat protein